jgi:vesicle-fusing ATPase
MERSRGNLTILATNRRGDIDEAFLRRLRYVVDFPLPGPAERARIWESSVPPGVDASEVNFAFLAKRFELSGGNIRSAMFNACLQSASSEGPEKRLSMEHVVIAVRRELDKTGRTVGLEQFGRYAPAIERLGLGR